MVNLAVCVVEGLLPAGLEERWRIAGLNPTTCVQDAVPRDIPALIVGRSAAPICSWLCRATRVAPTFAWMVGCDCDASRMQILACGAADVFSETDDDLNSLVAHLTRYRDVRALLESSLVTQKLGGQSAAWLRALTELVMVARSDSPSLLILGETGTGKDCAARLLHDVRPTAGGEFVVVHCGAIVATLSGSELFGHRRGAFSGADRDREGALARANGGTLFLDEVAELTPSLQTELLRVLQDGTYRPVGDDRERVSRFRVVAATHKNLREQVAQGAFREDLYHRLRGAEVHLPPLRERRTDIPELIRLFAREFLGTDAVIDARVERMLLRHPFPGNVRELKSIIRAACARSPDAKTLRLACLPVHALADLEGGVAWSESDLDASAEAAVSHGVSFNDFVDAAKDALVRAALGLAGGSVKEAAQRISVSERCVQLRRRAERVSRLPPAVASDETLDVAV